MKTKRYTKVVPTNCPFAICAIYEPHPFRSSAISEAVNRKVDTGVPNDSWVWVFYDWCGNPVAIGSEKPQGDEVEKFTPAMFEGIYCSYEDAQRMCEYFNKEQKEVDDE